MAVEPPIPDLGAPIRPAGSTVNRGIDMTSSAPTSSAPSRRPTPIIVSTPSFPPPHHTSTVHFPDSHIPRSASPTSFVSPPTSAPPFFTPSGTSTPARHNSSDRHSPSGSPRQSPRTVDVPKFNPPFRRQPTFDRRIVSDSRPRPVKRAGSGALLHKRPSVVTGGYETSDSSGAEVEEEIRSNRDKASVPFPNGYGEAAGPSTLDKAPRRKPSFPTSSSYTNRPPHVFPKLEQEGGRRRAKSMVTSMDEDAWRSKAHRLRQGSRDHLRASPTQSPRLAPNGTVPSPLPSPTPNRIGKSPDKKGKGRANNLAASLGLEGGSNGDVSLTPDQVIDLINDSDVGNALRLLNNQAGPSRISPNPNTFPPLQRQESPSPIEPFIAHAPPALTGDPSPSVLRERLDSNASSIGPQRSRYRDSSISSVGSPLQKQTAAWAKRTRSGSTADPELLAHRRRRASSRVDMDGGHVPFTHHIPVSRLEEEPIRDVEEGAVVATPEDSPLNGSSPSIHTPPTPMTTLPSTTKKNGMTRSRFSQLFNPKKTGSSRDLRADGANGHVSHPSKEDRARDAALREQVRQREREKVQQDLERRRIEQERRDAELAHERRYQVLTQVTAHPDAERLAYKASSHFRAFYNYIYEGLEHPPRMNPLAVLRFKQKTEEQTEARQRWEKMQKQGSQSQVWEENSSGRPRPSESSNVRSIVPKEPAAGWRYSVADITAYKDADGVVNYFVPPRQPVEEIVLDRTPSPQVVEEGSSVAGSMSKRSLVNGRVAETSYELSRSAPSLRSGPSAISQEHLSLSRSPSAETRPRENRLSHQKHQSLGSLGPQVLTHALKAPFEKLGSVTRRHRDATMSPTEDEGEPTHRSPQSQPGSLRRSYRRAIDTNEDESHLAKRFLRSQRAGGARLPGAEPIVKSPTALEPPIRVRETELRLSRQAEARRRAEEQARERSQAEDEASVQAQQLETQVYADRKAQLDKAQRKLGEIDVAIDQFDNGIRHSLAQADQIVAVFKTTAQVDIDFPDINGLRTRYLNRNRSDSTDPLSPMTSGRSSPLDARKPPSRQNTLVKRRPSNAPSTLYMLGIRPWPRRSSLDPTGRMRVDPVQRAALTIDHAREQNSAMLLKRDETVRQLRAMIGQIDALIKQKDAVRSWTKRALEDIRVRRLTLDALRAELSGNTATRIKRITDQVTDTGVRTFISPLLKVFLVFVQFFRWADSRRSAKKRFEYGNRKIVAGTSKTCWAVTGMVMVLLAGAYWADVWIAWLAV